MPAAEKISHCVTARTASHSTHREIVVRSARLQFLESKAEAFLSQMRHLLYFSNIVTVDAVRSTSGRTRIRNRAGYILGMEQPMELSALPI